MYGDHSPWCGGGGLNPVNMILWLADVLLFMNLVVLWLLTFPIEE